MLDVTKNIYEHVENNYPFMLKLLNSIIFNMIATLAITNCELTSDLTRKLQVIIDTISESIYIDEQNLNKFLDYYGNKEAIDNFRGDFLEISDEEKNDALFCDVHEDAQNQFLIKLKTVPKSQSSHEAVTKAYEEYMKQKNTKIVAHKRLSKRLGNLLKNVKLARKTENIQNQKENLSLGNIMWITQTKEADIRKSLKALYQHQDLRNVLKASEAILNRLYNIFSSHYTIKNSFDTHFIVEKFDKINYVTTKAREDLSTKIEEIYSENKEADESFNPFIEIDENQEEKKYVGLEIDDKINEAVQGIVKQINEAVEGVETELEDWLSQKAAPEMLNIEVKQQNLKQKLKWEKMYNSKEKWLKLTNVMKKIRTNKHRK